jgi:hypothetical protein
VVHNERAEMSLQCVHLTDVCSWQLHESGKQILVWRWIVKSSLPQCDLTWRRADRAAAAGVAESAPEEVRPILSW